MFHFFSDKYNKGDQALIFENLKWRRKGERRFHVSDPMNPTSYTEKRFIGDRRNNFMALITKIIFPRANDDF